ncbi:MAG TPA: hypothetical protein ENI23_17590 [bacterium]|nr:hypothetical protein [bacterium]
MIESDQLKYITILLASSVLAITFNSFWLGVYSKLKLPKKYKGIIALIIILAPQILATYLFLSVLTNPSTVMFILVLILFPAAIFLFRFTLKRSKFTSRRKIVFHFVTVLIALFISVNPLGNIAFLTAITPLNAKILNRDVKVVETLIEGEKIKLIEKLNTVLSDPEFSSYIEENDTESLKEYKDGKRNELSLDLLEIILDVEESQSGSDLIVLGSMGIESAPQGKETIISFSPLLNSPINILATRMIIDQKGQTVGRAVAVKKVTQEYFQNIEDLLLADIYLLHKNKVYYQTNDTVALRNIVTQVKLDKLNEKEIAIEQSSEEFFYIRHTTILSDDNGEVSVALVRRTPTYKRYASFTIAAEIFFISVFGLMLYIPFYDSKKTRIK